MEIIDEQFCAEADSLQHMADSLRNVADRLLHSADSLTQAASAIVEQAASVGPEVLEKLPSSSVPEVSPWLLIPFAVMLLGIAVLPLLAEKFWESNRNKMIVTALIAVPSAIMLVCFGLGHQLLHQMLFDYIPFIVLLLALFVVTGGIRISGDITATPIVNTVILLMGFLLASFMGTTGAAMLMIRPLLEINKQRIYKTHTVLFFIALVANCGGILTPLGDPPLFLLYLRGAEFSWFFNLAPEWVFVGLALLAIYYVWDSFMYRKEPTEALQRDLAEQTPIRTSGRINFLYLGMIIASVVFINEAHIPAMADGPVVMKFLREIALAVIILLSLFTTRKEVRALNRFSWEPIAEVAILFVGIFVTMTPALLFLNSHAAGLGLSKPWHFLYCTGLLSSFLDNAPTAVSFYSVANGLVENGTLVSDTMVAGIPEIVLKAISMGAVFFGALTYIGNGPNFMVKSIAEQNGVKMPSFFSYMLKFSLIVLLPVYIVAQLIFL